jgi:transcriptional regulator with XRE-family HTH domain
MIAKQPKPRDIEVARRVRARRIEVGMSQEKLGEKLGLTFQQVQKYEKGTNRIGAGRLQDIADILDVPVSYFFGGATPAVEPGQEIFGFLDTAKALRLVRAFSRIGVGPVQDRLVELAEQLAADGKGRH